MKILIVEDNRELQDIMTSALEAERCVVETAMDFRTASRKIEEYDYDCIVLDLMLPDGSGLDLLRRLKELRKSEGVIIVSAKDSLDDRVAGLEMGADDYLPKPFHVVELVARIRSIARRKAGDGNIDIVCGNVAVSPSTFTVTVDGRPLEMNRKEYDILLYFMSRADHLIKKELLAEAVWGDHIDQTDDFDFLYAQVKNVRRRLSDAGADIEIKAVYGFGYKLIIKEPDK